MANIIPPEYFGLYGLGSSLQGIGQDIQQKKERKKEQTLQDILMRAQANPNDPGAMYKGMVEAGLLDPNEVPYVPSAMEKLQQVGWEGLNETERLQVGQQLGLAPGQDPNLARRGAVATVQGAEQGVELGGLQLSEARDARDRRTQFQESINTPWFRRMAGLPEDAEITPGSLEAIRLGQQITGDNLDNVIREARANNANEREIAEIERLRADTRRINFQLKQLKEQGKDDGTLAWMKGISENTGWSPNMINMALDNDPNMSDEVRDNIIKDVSNYQESLRAGIQQEIREGNSVAGQTLSQLVEWQKAGIEIFAPTDPIWMQFTTDALNEIGVPAAFVPGEVKRFWPDVDPRVLIGDEAENFFEQASTVVGESLAEAPSIDQNSANALAPELVSQYGSVGDAISAVEGNEALTRANKNLILGSLRTLQGSDPEPETPKATTPSTPEPTLESIQQEIDTLVEEYESLKNFEPERQEPGSEKVTRVRRIRELAREINKLKGDKVRLTRAQRRNQ